MASRSGTDISLLVSSLRYLGLITENGRPQPELERLVTAKGKERQEEWDGILRKAYLNVFKLNLQRVTTEQLSQELAREGLNSSDTIRKALNFFCLAAKQAGIELSPHVKPYAGRRRSRLRARAVSAGQRELIDLKPQVAPDDKNGSTGWEILLSKFPKFDPAWPENQRKNWVDVFERLAKILK